MATKSTTKVVLDPTTTHRVFNIDEALRESVKNSRIQSGSTNTAWLSQAIGQELESLASTLELLGFKADEGATRPIRVELSTADCDELRRVSDVLGIPAVMLLKVCMARASAGTRSSGTAKPKSRPAPVKAKKATGAKRKAKTAKSKKGGA